MYFYGVLALVLKDLYYHYGIYFNKFKRLNMGLDPRQYRGQRIPLNS